MPYKYTQAFEPFTVNDECYFFCREAHEVPLIHVEVFDFELLVFQFLLRDAQFLRLDVDQILPKKYFITEPVISHK